MPNRLIRLVSFFRDWSRYLARAYEARQGPIAKETEARAVPDNRPNEMHSIMPDKGESQVSF